MRVNELNQKNSLIIKVALFLNYLSKDNYQKLALDIKKENNPDVDILKHMRIKNFIRHMDISVLRRNCSVFDTAHKDMRFGQLCVAFGFLTRFNLELAIDEQERLAIVGNSIRLGKLLVDAGMLDKGQRNLVVHKQRGESHYPKCQARVASKEEAGTKTDPPEQLPSSHPSPDIDMTLFREIRETDVIILIQNDALKAYLLKTDLFDSNLRVTDLKELMGKNGIIYGIPDDDSLSNFIKDPAYTKTLFETADGVPGIDGSDAQIVYMFERDYLKPGLLSPDGSMDFKDRGEIPFVSRGDVLAEKIPPKQGRDGINIFGDVIPTAEPAGIDLTPGKGVRLSKDQFKAIAEVDGNPKVTSLNEISVNDAYIIKGDVDYKTGHVKFDKNIFITGSIKNGFRVEGIDVVVNRLDGGIIKARGDVFIQGGVTESVIEAKGKIKAGFIHRSRVSCMGEVMVSKEMVDSDAVLEGGFDMPHGRLFSSRVCAKGGAKIYRVGSEKTEPATIVVGTSGYLEKELDRAEKQLKKSTAMMEENTIKKTELEKQLEDAGGKLHNFEKSRQRTLSLMENMKKKSSSSLDLFTKSLDEAGVKIHEIKDQISLLETKLKKLKREATACAELVKKCFQDKFDLKRINEVNRPKPVLDVSGIITSRTKVCGPNTQLILSKDLVRSRIMEMNAANNGSNRASRELVITSL